MNKIYQWIDRIFFELVREFKLSYLPPLMVYLAYGISGLTAVVSTFFVKDYLGLSAAFLAALGFWAGIPWALKMPLGHLVDLLWRFKSLLVYLGAALVAIGLLIMIGLLSNREAMAEILSPGTWFVISALLGPVGYVLQDVVADAMTVEAIPPLDKNGRPYSPGMQKLMHTTMQTLGRAALVGSGMIVYAVNIYYFNDVGNMTEQDKVDVYLKIYWLALFIPVISVLGVLLGGVTKYRHYRSLIKHHMDPRQAWEKIFGHESPHKPNWWILGGSLFFVAFTLTVGIVDIPFNQEIIFGGSMAIVIFLMYRLVQVLDEKARRILIGTAVIIFIYRALPNPGPGSSWWMIDILDFDQQFLSILNLIGASLALLGMFILRRFMAEKSMAYIIGFLTLVSFVLAMPIVGMFYGFHEWTAAHTGGIVDARFIAIVDTAIESPFGQVAMIPMLAWIANSAPTHLKATFFAVMASFSNLALSLSQLGTKYLNQIFLIQREVKDPVTGDIQTPQDYSELGMLLITVSIIGLVLPFLAIAIVKIRRLATA